MAFENIVGKKRKDCSLFTTQSRLLTTLRKMLKKTLWEKEKMLVILPKTNFNFSVTFNSSSANAFNLDQSKNLLFVKRVNQDFLSFLTMGSTSSDTEIIT